MAVRIVQLGTPRAREEEAHCHRGILRQLLAACGAVVAAD